MKIKAASITLIFVLSLVLMASIVSAVSVVAERSLTLARVREIDFQIIASLLTATAPAGLDSIDTHAVEETFSRLRDFGSDNIRIGLLLKKGHDIIASNLGMMSVHDLQKKYGLHDGAIETVDLGNDWTLTGILIDRKYDFTAWHSFLTIPYQQYRDGRGASWGIITHKAEITFYLMLGVGLIVLLFWGVWWTYAARRVAALEKGISAASDRIQGMEQTLVSAKAEASALFEQSVAYKAKLTDSQARLEKSYSRHDAEVVQLQETIERYQSELHEIEETWAAAENKAAQISEALNAEREAKLALEDRLARTQPRSGKDCSKVLKGIWNISWHPEALKEAHNFFTRYAQPFEKRQLRELLHEVSQIKTMPSDNNRWSAFKNSHPRVWHNGGRQQAKLYWTQVEGETIVIAVASGKDNHERFDGGDTLKLRVDGVRSRSNKAA